MAYKKSGFKLKDPSIIQGTDSHRSALKSTINVEAMLQGAKSANKVPDETAANEAAWSTLQNAIISKGTDNKDNKNPDAPKEKKTLKSTLTGVENKIKTGLGNIKHFFTK